MAHLFKPQIVRWIGPDGKRCKPNAPGAVKRKEQTKDFYAKGAPLLPGKKFKLASHRRVADQLLAKLIEKYERGEHGLVDLDAGRQLLAPLVDEFEQSLSRKGDEKHAKYAAACVRKVLAAAQLVTLSDLRSSESAAKVEAAVWDMTEGEGAVSEATASRTGMHARQFGRWLWRRKKLLDGDPLGGVDLPSQTTTGKWRAFAPAEMASLIDGTTNSPAVIRGLTGPERAALYLTAAATGFRVSELAAIEPSHLHLDADPPVVALPGKYTKNGEDACQPLPPAVVARLRPLAVAVGPGEKVFGGSWPERAADVLREDLKAADVPEVVNGKHAVFHSLRHTYTNLLGRAAAPKAAQELARHSTPLLTFGRYAHTDMQEKAETVARLPLPGSEHTSPFAHLTRTELERLTASLAVTLAAVTGADLVVPRVVLEMEPTGDVLRLPETTRPGTTPRPSRRRA